MLGNAQKTLLYECLLKSRTAADSILANFNNISSPKMLYSYDDIDYYILIKNNDDEIEEYYVRRDASTETLLISKFDSSYFFKTRKRRKYHKNIMNHILTEFDSNKREECILSIENSKSFLDKSYMVYYVIKSSENKNYNEFRLSFEDSLKILDTSISGYFFNQIISYRKYFN